MKYCDKCGRQIGDDAKFCQYCGNVMGEINKGRNNRDKHINIKLIIGTAVGASVVLCIVGLLLHNGVIGDSGDSNSQSGSQDMIAQENLETDDAAGFEAYYESIIDDEVVFENETVYVDSQILITATDGVSKDQVEEIAKEQGGTIAGYISISNDYQIEFTDGKTYNELEEIIDKLEQDDRLENVMLNYAVQMNTDAVNYKKDPWIDAALDSDTSGFEWSEVEPDGSNWWAEAIMMPSVWDMDIEFQPVKVGIYDTMFDTENEDIDDKFIKIWNNPEDENENCIVTTLYESAKNANKETANEYAHGSHVAGLIAAEAENGFGIAGVSQNAKLYGFSFYSSASDTAAISAWSDIFEIKYCIASMLNEGVQVINFSVNFSELLVAAQNGVTNAVEDLKMYSVSMEDFLSKCLDAGYDFLIVKCSGNENGYYWVECEKSEKHPYGYMRCAAEEGKNDTVYDASFDFMGAIDDKNVSRHILIVGAVENHMDYFTTAYFSTVGSRVDVYAPGVDILSDLPLNITGLKSGTSMATPIVTGIASLVWGVNPNLSATQVVDIIKASMSVSLFDSEEVSNIFHKSETTPIVNAHFAVKLAMNLKADADGNTAEIGTITGMPYEISKDGSANVLGGTTVTVKDYDGNIIDTETATKAGGFSFVLPAGNYIITAELSEYETSTQEVVLQKNDVINLNMELKLAVVSVQFDHLIRAAGEKAVISGVNRSGEVVWSVETRIYTPTELNGISEIGVNGDSYYYVESGVVKALNMADGTLRWENDDFGAAGASSTIGENGDIYLCGYYSVNFFVTDSNGVTKCKIDEFDPNYFWPHKIMLEGGEAIVAMAGSPTGQEVEVHVNLSDYSYTLPEIDT